MKMRTPVFVDYEGFSEGTQANADESKTNATIDWGAWTGCHVGERCPHLTVVIVPSHRPSANGFASLKSPCASSDQPPRGGAEAWPAAHTAGDAKPDCPRFVEVLVAVVIACLKHHSGPVPTANQRGAKTFMRAIQAMLSNMRAIQAMLSLVVCSDAFGHSSLPSQIAGGPAFTLPRTLYPSRQTALNTACVLKPPKEGRVRVQADGHELWYQIHRSPENLHNYARRTVRVEDTTHAALLHDPCALQTDELIEPARCSAARPARWATGAFGLSF